MAAGEMPLLSSIGDELAAPHCHRRCRGDGCLLPAQGAILVLQKLSEH